jgi:predicted MFS family arabinose efflux permease
MSASERLPGPFLRLWTADALSTAGDGFTLVAAPLLLTTLTDNPVLIAGGAFAAQLPWLLFGLHSGTVVDHTDRRRLIMRVDAVRAVLMAGLAVSILTGEVTVAIVYLLLFASGAGDTLVVTAGTSMVPMLVGPGQLTRANARLIATRLGGGLLLARPLGAWLFTHGHATPFFVDAVSFFAGVVLLFGLPVRKEPVGAVPRKRGGVREGLQILWADRVLRVLALCIFVMNVTLSGTMAVLVIYSTRRLGLGPTGFGLLGAALAVGGLVGTALVSRLLKRFGTTMLLKVGLLIESGTQLTLAITSSQWVAGAALLIFGIHSSVWSVLTVSLRQHRTTDGVRGRVMAAYMVLSVGGSALGALLGGTLVAVGSITTPMWFGAAVVAVVFLAVMPTLRSADVELQTTS